MKTLQQYFNDVISIKGDCSMKPQRIMAEQNDGSEELYNSHKDRWSRNAKHQLPLAEKHNLINQWKKGDIALFEGQHVEIIIPKGPNSTVGIVVDGKTKMVVEKLLSKIDEAVMGGLLAVSPLNRMMQLAGISNPSTITPSEEPIAETEVLNEADPTNMFNALMKANLAGEFKNNPDAARVATIGQIMAGLETVVAPLRTKLEPDMLKKIDVAVGLGAAFIKNARLMTKA